MNRTILTLAVVAASAANAFGQSTYARQPVTAQTCPPKPARGWVASTWMPYGYHASSAAEGYMRGAAAMVEAQGQWNLNTSQAMIHAAEAGRLAMENRLRKLEISYKMKQVNKELRAAERASHTLGGTPVRNPKASTQVQRAISLFDETGQVAWPTALQGDKYQNERTAIDGFFAGRLAGVSSAHQAELSECVRALAERLQDEVREVPGGQYMAAKHFLEKLAAEVGSGRDGVTSADTRSLPSPSCDG